MSYLDGKIIPGSHSPNTVWLTRSSGGVLGIDFDDLNDYIRKYNENGYYKIFPFWRWLSTELHMIEALPDAQDVVSFDILWNEGNANLNKVLTIKSWRNP